MKQKQLNHRRSFFRNLSPLLFRQLWWVKRIFLESRQSNSPVINRIITSLVHELPPRSVDDTKTTENHVVVISLTDESEATSVEKKVDMKDAPLVGKLGSTEKPKFLKAWVKWNLMYKVFFLKITCARISQSSQRRTGFWPRSFWILRYRDEVEVYKTKTKRASNYTITCYLRVRTIYFTFTFTWTTERKTYERLHHLRKHCQTNTTTTLVLYPL